jgi:flagellar protein FlgJ
MEMQGPGDQFAYEVQGLQKLKNTATKDPNQGVKAAARQFEALMLNQMLKSMRAASAPMKSDLVESSSTDFYTEMLDTQLAQNMAGKGGLGLAERIEAQLRARGMVKSDPREYQESLISGIPRAKAKSLTSFDSLPTINTRQVTAIQSQSDRGASKDFASNSNPFTSASENAEKAPHVQAFLNQMSSSATVASKVSGVPAKLILAQAALETGWGREKIKTERGENSFNVFGIKAGDYWTGKTTNVATTEYVNGVAQRSIEKFRVYDSYDDAFTDYARLVGNNPRYQGVVNANSDAAAAHAIQRGGYATDPSYATKLISVMNNLNEPLPIASISPEIPEPFGSKIW